jgi:hypothetical protein
LHDQAPANRIAFKDLSKDALSQLRTAGLDKHRIEPIQERFSHLGGAILESIDDNKYRYREHDPAKQIDEFWRAQANGLAVLATPESMQTFRLPNRPKPLAEVADRFHLTPLIHAMTSPQHIFVLALSEDAVRLVHAIVNLPPTRIHVPDLPKDADQATRRPDGTSYPHAVWGLEDQKVLLQKYLRKVGQAVSRALAEQTTPLVIAAAKPLASLFRPLNTYEHLVDDMIEGNPDHLSDAQLEDAALPILDRLYERELKATLARYDELKPRRATTDVSYAAHAATAGAIDELVVDLDAVIPGLVSDVDGSVRYATSDNAKTYSVVDEVARRALCTGARVLGSTRERLPNHDALVAILRYEFGVISG